MVRGNGELHGFQGAPLRHLDLDTRGLQTYKLPTLDEIMCKLLQPHATSLENISMSFAFVVPDRESAKLGSDHKRCPREVLRLNLKSLELHMMLHEGHRFLQFIHPGHVFYLKFTVHCFYQIKGQLEGFLGSLSELSSRTGPVIMIRDLEAHDISGRVYDDPHDLFRVVLHRDTCGYILSAEAWKAGSGKPSSSTCETRSRSQPDLELTLNVTVHEAMCHELLRWGRCLEVIIWSLSHSIGIPRVLLLNVSLDRDEVSEDIIQHLPARVVTREPTFELWLNVDGDFAELRRELGSMSVLDSV